MAVYLPPMLGNKRINVSYSDEHYEARPAGEPFPYIPLPVAGNELNEAFIMVEPERLLAVQPLSGILNKDGPKEENSNKAVSFSDDYYVHYYEEEEHEKSTETK